MIIGVGKTITISKILVFVSLPARGKNKDFPANLYSIKYLTTISWKLACKTGLLLLDQMVCIIILQVKSENGKKYA